MQVLAQRDIDEGFTRYDFIETIYYLNFSWTPNPNSKGFIKLKKPQKITKVILCSGKIYFDLIEAREKLKRDDIIFFRIEQLYPFPAKALAKELKSYTKNAKFYWCQEVF